LQTHKNFEGGFADTPEKTNSQTSLQLVRTMSNLSTLSKDKSQIGWRPVHPWWTILWFRLHWSREAGNKPNFVLWRKSRKL